MKLIKSLSIRTISALILLATIGICAFADNVKSPDCNIFNTGSEPSRTADSKAVNEIRVWPIRVSSSINVSNLSSGDIVTILAQNGQVAAKATAGNDGFVQIDLSDIEPGIYTVSALGQNVKITKH